MEHVPDAPWIRDAELNGVPEDPPVKCPICGEECETIYEDKNGEVFGCDKCTKHRDAYDWKADQDRGDGW